MAGHSQFKNIMYRKGAQDKKRARMFSRLSKEITVACKSSAPDPEHNPRLRSAIRAARAANMPNDNIKRATLRATDDSSAAYEETRYEGYGPGGEAFIVEALTDNRNRTAAQVRSIFAKSGGNLGELGSVAYLFDRKGVIELSSGDDADATIYSSDALMELALEAGADDFRQDGDAAWFICEIDDLMAVADAIDAKVGSVGKTGAQWLAKSEMASFGEKAEKLLSMLEQFEELEDVQNIYTNIEFSDEQDQ